MEIEIGIERVGESLDALSDRRLLGRTADLSGCATADILNPADEQVIARIVQLSQDDIAQSIVQAQDGQHEWRRKTALERADTLHDWGYAISKAKEDIATIITLEQGKPIGEARDEVDYAVSFVHWFADEGRRLYGRTIPAPTDNARLMTFYQPVGVVAAITPWNWPLAMITRKAAAAMAAGCSVIVKPAPETPLTGLALLELARRVGLGGGVFSVVVGAAEMIGEALLNSPIVRSLSFTGSTATGKRLLAQSASTVKKVAMELGGHAPFVVCPDADMDLAVEAAIQTKFEASGQNCIGLNACLVHQSLYEEFCDRIVTRVSALQLGNGLDPRTRMGPMISDRATRNVLRHIDDACTKGATCLAGGRRLDGPGFFVEPTVLANVTPDMAILREETFGPVLPITPFSEIDEALAIANQTEFGLGAYVFARDSALIWYLTEHLEAGLVGVNTWSMTGPAIPFGGIKQSGLGREGSDTGLEPFVELKYVCQGNLNFQTQRSRGERTNVGKST